jgi:hypothetical protein
LSTTQAHPKPFQHPRRDTVLFANQAEQYMLGPDGTPAEPARFFLRVLNDADGRRCEALQ